jgi:hypothetical protein
MSLEDHPGEALALAGLTRLLTQAENTVVFDYIGDLRSRAAETDRLNEQLIGENPMAGLVTLNTAALRETLQCTAVLNHATVPAALAYAAEAKKVEGLTVQEGLQVAQNESVSLEIRKIKAALPSEWTATRLGAIGSLVVTLAGVATAIIHALLGTAGG